MANPSNGKPWHHLGWWIARLPKIVRFLWKDLDDFVQLYTTKRLWITAIVLWNIFAAIAYLNGWWAAPLLGTLFVLQMIVSFVYMIGMVIIQFVAIFWYMSKSRTTVITPNDPGITTFADYKGQPKLVALTRDWLEILRNPVAFQEMGGKLIRGLLLYGPPGTGKTLLAKAMAGEGKSAFLSMEGSSFRAMFMGVDVMKMKAFIDHAKKLAKEYGSCIAYIDEIDAIAQSRGGVQGGQQQTGMMGGMFGGGMGGGALTRLLYEMDGMDEGDGFREKLRNKWCQRLGIPIPHRKWHVMFMGSTNRPDVLDPAIMRPGRIDQKIPVNAPDKAGRRQVLELYISKVAHDNSINIEALVESTPRATPAQIASAITKDAVRLALVDGRKKISQRDVEKGLQEQMFGIETPIEEMEPVQREQVAYHEAGHTVAAHHLRPDKQIVSASIIARKESLGRMVWVDKNDVYALPLTDWPKEILVAMAGQASTVIHFGAPWTGPTGDYAAANHIIDALLVHGHFGPPTNDLEKLRTKYVKKIDKFWIAQEKEVDALLREHRAEVEAVALALLEKETVNGDELIAIMTKAQTKEGVS